MIRDQIEAVLEDVRTWPPEDQDELAEIDRDIAARRSGDLLRYSRRIKSP